MPFSFIYKLKARFTKQGKLALQHNSKTATDGCGKFCMWFTDNAQMKEHRHIISFTYRPTQYTKRSAIKQSQCSSGAGDLLTTGTK